MFEASTGKTTGLEVTNIIARATRYHAEKHKVTVTLRTIVSQVYQYFKKTKGIALTLDIDFWDKRKWCARTYRETMEAAYDPGFRHLEAKPKEIKQLIIDAFSQHDFKANSLVKRSIEVGSQIFNITASNWYDSYTSVHVSNEGMCKEDPFEEVQNVINEKNEKHKKYIERCNGCDLLVFSDDSSTGNFVDFTNKIKSYKFHSAFKNVYSLDLGFDTKVIKLKTKHFWLLNVIYEFLGFLKALRFWK